MPRDMSFEIGVGIGLGEKALGYLAQCLSDTKGDDLRSCLVREHLLADKDEIAQNIQRLAETLGDINREKYSL